MPPPGKSAKTVPICTLALALLHIPKPRAPAHRGLRNSSPKQGNLMTQVKSGDTVQLHYTGTLDDGTKFDSSAGRDPLEFTVGSGQVIPGLDKEIPGMAVGDKKVVNIPATEAYGDTNPDAIQAIPRDQIPEEIPLEVGLQLQMQSPTGQVIPVTVAEFSDTEVTLDANHPLAGKDLTFDIELVSIS